MLLKSLLADHTMILGNNASVLERLLHVVPKPRVDVHAIVTDVPYAVNRPGRIVMDSDKNVQDFTHDTHDCIPTAWVEPASELLIPGGACWVFVPYREGATDLLPVLENYEIDFKRPVFCRIKATAVYPKNRKNFPSIVETAVFCRKERRNGAGRNIVWNAKSNTDPNNDWPDDWIDVEYHPVGRRIHPTQKSISVFRKMIELTTEPGDLVLDPFAGSGVSCLAAMECGRRWLGVELNPRYYSRAMEALGPRGVRGVVYGLEG